MNYKSFLYFAKKAVSILSLILFMVLFQNCGTSEDSLQDALNSQEERAAQSLPFAYDLTVDHMAYMSCESDQVNPAGTGRLFNFKAGAFTRGEGVRFNENFLNTIGQTNPSVVARRLANSPRNEGSGVVMSVRPRSALQEPISFDEGGEGFRISIGPLLFSPAAGVTLSQSEIINFMQRNSNTGVNYLEGFPGLTEKRFEGQISFNQLGAQRAIIDALESDSFLTFTFATSGLENRGVRARSPFSATGEGTDLSSNRSVWGKGYAPRFARNFPIRTTSPRRVLSSVQGFDLESGNTNSESWTCSTSDRYIIVRPEDAIRRYDAAPAVVNGLANLPEDGTYDSTGQLTGGYDDGGPNVGGYPMTFLAADPITGIRSLRTHKVLCPTLPDFIASGGTSQTDPAWLRIRNILPSEDWFVYRGPRYNCVVPKSREVAQACYGQFENQSNEAVVQYLPDEDEPERRIRLRQEDPPPSVPRLTQCEGTGTETRFCPHYVSVCYKN